jgi:hypothetical protein
LTRRLPVRIWILGGFVAICHSAAWGDETFGIINPAQQNEVVAAAWRILFKNKVLHLNMAGNSY